MLIQALKCELMTDKYLIFEISTKKLMLHLISYCNIGTSNINFYDFYFDGMQYTNVLYVDLAANINILIA